MTSNNPIYRPRRSRKNIQIKNMLSEVVIDASNLILPVFICSGYNIRREIKNLPGQFQFSIDVAVEKIKYAQSVGINFFMLFPSIDSNLKSCDGKEALNSENLICEAIKVIKSKISDVILISDVALDPYTDHGHDGVLGNDGDVLNDQTVEVLSKQALNQAKAGSDIVAPSDMMDGRVAQIRNELDKNGFENVLIMSYSVKYASHLYGPFRNAVGSNSHGPIDKSTYQMDFKRSREALIEIDLDVKESADMVIIKPAGFYLDIIKEARQNFKLPIIGYQVSGEYAMMKYAASAGAIDFDRVLFESLIAIKRAGADAIITYGALEIAEMLTKK